MTVHQVLIQHQMMVDYDSDGAWMQVILMMITMTLDDVDSDDNNEFVCSDDDGDT